MPGHCRKCGQPSGACCCGCRECRKEAKELLVARGAAQEAGGAMVLNMLDQSGAVEKGTQIISGLSNATGFIGGGCCVTLAIEYAPTVATAAFMVGVLVKDSEGTMLAWARSEPAGTGYRVHECIITTKPGATLLVEVSNCTARARWCEVFSC